MNARLTSRHRQAKPLLLFVTAAVLLVVGQNTAAQAQSTLDKIRKDGTATIAIANQVPWMTLNADGTPGGLGPELDRAILDRMGVKNAKGEVMEYGAMIPALQAGRADLSSSGGMYIRPERCKAVLFSDPVQCGPTGFILSVTNADKVRSFKALAASGLRLAVCAGCAEQKLALDAGVKSENIIVWPDGTSAMKLLQDKRTDVVADDAVAANDLQKTLGDASTKVVFVEDAPLTCGAAAFNMKDADLRDAYNDGLKQIIADGTYMAILKKYGLEFLANDRPKTSTAKLCGE